MTEERILLSHGSGGKLTHRLLEEIVFPAFRNPYLEKNDDSAVVELKGRTAFTTDSFVIKPLFFPGGDIGKLAVCGTVNDLAVMAALPRFVTSACIVEEGFAVADFRKIILSMKKAAEEAGVMIVGGDMKVVEKGACDGMFINTSGVGTVMTGTQVSADRARPGDAVIINGPIGDHGAAVMASRQDYGIRVPIKSDCCPLNGLAQAALAACPRVHVMRDPTRGGVATTLNEIARSSKVTVAIEENLLPVRPAVRGFSEVLGIDPLYMANEGKILIFCPDKDASRVLKALSRHPYGKGSRVIGRVEKGEPAVLLRTSIGSTRILDMLTGEQLPRIC
ncbi:MAG: hydrogenase expression/formation protein HypE [Deltaproteobacteria bacterium]